MRDGAWCPQWVGVFGRYGPKAGDRAEMAGMSATVGGRYARLGPMLFLCFLAGLFGGAAMLMGDWEFRQIMAVLAALLLSAVTLLTGLRHMVLRRLRADLASAGCVSLHRAAFEKLRDIDHLLIDDPMVLRRAERSLAALQPRLDPRMRPVILALAAHMNHPLAHILAASLEAAGVVPDALSNVDAHPSGQVNAEWRGHAVSLYAQPLSYGDLKLSMALRMDGEAAATVVFDENLRADASAMVARLKTIGITPMLLAEDRTQLLGPMARQLGLMVQVCRDDGDKNWAAQRHLAAGHVPMILSRGAVEGRWALRAGASGKAVLQGQALSAIAASIRLVRAYYAAQCRAVKVIIFSHLAAWALLVSGLPDMWVMVSAWTVCGLSMWQAAMRDRAGKDRPLTQEAASAAI